MSSPKIVDADKSLSLPDINRIVGQQEDLLGPLIAIGNDGSLTLLTFDMDIDPPPQHAVIATTGGGSPASPIVCKGKIFIKGTLSDAVATRPS